MTTRFSIDQKVLEDMLNYVIEKPYREVAQLIANVQRDVKPIEETRPKMPEENDDGRDNVGEAPDKA